MRVLVWITENTWQTCVDHARTMLPDDAQTTLLHVVPGDVEELLSGGPSALLGRRPRRPPSPPPSTISAKEAEAILNAARERLGRPAHTLSRRGRSEREVLAACSGFDLLILSRDGESRPGPKSLGPDARFVVDHAPCHVLLLWTPPARTPT